MERTSVRHDGGEPLPDHEPAVDAAALAELRDLQIEGEPDVLPELIEMLLADAEPRFASLRAAIDGANAPAVARGAHALKGTCGIFGARPMGRICGRLEEAAQATDLTNALDLLLRLEDEYARVRTALQTELAKS